MKRGTPRHPKVKFLAERLKIEHGHAVGILEMLWQYASEFYPAGDVGRATDRYIAEAVLWRKDPSILIAALVSEKWLDKVEGESRLLIHDWAVHAEDSVHMKLARQLRYFSDGSKPKYGRLSGLERSKANEFYADSGELKSASRAHAVPTDLDTSGMAWHGQAWPGSYVSSTASVETTEVSEVKEQTKRTRRSPEGIAWRSDRQRQCFEEFWLHYWRKKDKHAAMKAYAAKITTEKTHLRVMTAFRDQLPEMLAKEPGVRPHASTWINHERWTDEADPPMFSAGLSKGAEKIVETTRLFRIMQQQEKAQ